MYPRFDPDYLYRSDHHESIHITIISLRDEPKDVTHIQIHQWWWCRFRLEDILTALWHQEPFLLVFSSLFLFPYSLFMTITIIMIEFYWDECDDVWWRLGREILIKLFKYPPFLLLLHGCSPFALFDEYCIYRTSLSSSGMSWGITWTFVSSSSFIHYLPFSWVEGESVRVSGCIWGHKRWRYTRSKKNQMKIRMARDEKRERRSFFCSVFFLSPYSHIFFSPHLFSNERILFILIRMVMMIPCDSVFSHLRTR